MRRYVEIIEKTLELAWHDRALPPARSSDSIGSREVIEIAPYAWAMVGCVLERQSQKPAPLTLENDTKVIDSNGHARRVYRGLAVHAARVAGVETRLTAAAKDLSPSKPISSTDAEKMVDQVFFDLHQSRWSDFQLPSGALIAIDLKANPETTWYAELILLHALTTAACERRDSSLLARAKRGARFVASEIQPDHASSQPWAVHAMLLDVSTASLADLMLHCAGVQQPSTLDAVTVLLLADALRALRRIG